LLEEIDRDSDDVGRLLVEFEAAYQRSVDRNAAATRVASRLFGRSVPGMIDVQRCLRDDQILVEYFVGGEDAYLIALRREASLVVKLGRPAMQVNSSAQALRELLLRGRTAPDDTLWKGPAAFLYGVLVQPLGDHGLLNDRDHLIVSPQGKLLGVPFGCLLDSTGTMLVERFTLSFLPSASHVVVRAPERNGFSLLAIAPERKSLPFSEREVRGIPSTLFSSTQVLLDDQASTSEFMNHAPASDVIHIAAHGSIHYWNPLFSSLQMGDGPLELHRILNLRLSARLVVLSSCETGFEVGMTGEIARGHEAVGFPLVFLSSGVSSVIAPLWVVEDHAASDLMLSMYAHLQSTRRPDGQFETGAFPKALTLAQRRFVQSLDNQHKKHPFYWAGFYLTGNPN
jgi:CHAT domain-containing protein